MKLYAFFENGLYAEVPEGTLVGDRVRAFQVSYFDEDVKCYFTSKVLELTDWVYPAALETTNTSSPLFEGNEDNAF